MTAPVPKVSIIIPIRDRAALFATTVASLQQQSFTVWEAIVVDDHSEASQLELITRLVASDQRFRLIRNAGARRGANAGRNVGLAASTGEFVVFLDADDALTPDCLAHRVSMFQTHPDAGFIAFPCWYFHQVPGDSTALWNVFDDQDTIARFLRGDAPWQTSGPIWRRSVLQKLGSWNERTLSWQDAEFHLHALIAGIPYQAITEPDAFWRAAGEADSIGSRANRPRYVFNRVRMLGAVGQRLRDAGMLTQERRQVLSLQFFQHAFRRHLARRRALALWQLGRRLGLVSATEYWLAWLLDGLERIGRRVSRRGLTRLYPSLERQLCFGAVHHPLPESLGGAAAQLRQSRALASAPHPESPE